ncbi:hypothetical protein [Anaeromicrobium sediminis]|uniref:Uncharacterized protein n=1 Tax=Anaeromicrobium sediminis TaxID=1478221 RepID=A0A267MKC7_9FIRM|nr:hypothetical protein [Anaeromicrobium sediminis]PAB59862.1 hypothetical protein CCE28_07865 [Anaeromicrobium sediminis]
MIMIYVLSLFFVILGALFVSLGMLFVNYELSPLKRIVNKELVYKSNKLGVQVMVPGAILVMMAFWIIIKFN